MPITDSLKALALGASEAGRRAADSTLTAASGNITYFTPYESSWTSGKSPTSVFDGTLPSTTGVKTAVSTGSAMGDKSSINYTDITSDANITDEELKRAVMPTGVAQDRILKATSNNAWSNDKKRKEMLNEDKSNHQNALKFPYYIKKSSGLFAAQYDYQIMPGDSRFPTMVSLEDKLKMARASLGIPVHGDNDIARAMKYYMYNRFKTPDLNLAFNKLTTHVFFTRPDLNLLDCYNGIAHGANAQVKNHSDTDLLYKLNPYLFKLLTNNSRCGDSNNFNMLLSQQVKSFDIDDESLTTSDVGKTYRGHSIPYADGYNGRTTGDFKCAFEETSDLSVMRLMKLWITYIDNVSTGAWSPSYDLFGTVSSVGYNVESSYVFQKALDYAASVYVFKCGPDGEDVLYWTKYYGVYPTNTGASSMSWDASSNIGDSSRLSINFKYCYKRDMSPISLIEFNEVSGIHDLVTRGTAQVVESFNPNYAHSSRPYVGAPFIEMTLGDTEKVSGGVSNIGSNADIYGRKQTHIRLKFLKEADSRLSDNLLYRTNLHS